MTAAIAGKGYKVVQDPTLAHYLLQANILSVGKMDTSTLPSDMGARKRIR